MDYVEKLAICKKCPYYVAKSGVCTFAEEIVFDVVDCRKWHVEMARKKETESGDEMKSRIEIRDKCGLDDKMQAKLFV